jgi:hypothetical protein
MRSHVRKNWISKSDILLLLFFATTIEPFAEELIYTDISFPYRVVCKPGWIEVMKNDTVLILENSTPGKKTRMELYRYNIDTGVTRHFNWAAFNFLINKELVYSFGKLVFS